MQQSAGFLVYRRQPQGWEVFLVHPGGPYWKNKDDGAWSIVKGEFGPGEDPLEAAYREFREEVGQEIAGPLLSLKPVRQKGGKVVHAWAVEGEVDASRLKSNLFEMEWPPRSGRRQAFPEVDRGGWFSLAEARRKLLAGQRPLLDELADWLARRDAGETTAESAQ